MTSSEDETVVAHRATAHWRVRAGMSMLAIVIVVVSAALYFATRKPDPLTAEILVIGDSQISFGAGPTLSGFFSDLPNQCRDVAKSDQQIALLRKKRFSMIGTRSTSIQSWVTQKGRPWELLCHKDKRWGVNASAWGAVKPEKRRYVQIGEGELFQFCQPDRPPIQNLFAPGYYRPELLMIFVGGNGAGRLARNPNLAQQDVDQFVKDVPSGLGCLFMMTAPVYQTSQNDRRLTAQTNLRTAFSKHKERCSFVDGHTPATRAAIEGQDQYFRRDETGKVKDPYHADKTAGAEFLKLRRKPLCRALIRQFEAVDKARRKAS
ncbi:MAG: hypothetical protein AAF709_19700 [Pseudomonadota bacterium]